MKIINDNYTTNIPLHVLRRQSGRGIRVLGRHEGKHGSLASLALVYIPIATSFNDGYDGLRTGFPTYRKKVEQGRRAVGDLGDETIAWSSVAMRDIEGFDRSAYLPHDKTPDEIITAAEDMVEVVSLHQESAEEKLPYGDDLIAAMTAAIQTAVKEWGEAQAAMADRQEQQAKVRRLAYELQQSLISLRLALRAVLGPSHRDFQKLRLAKARTLDEEDPEVESGEAEAGEPVQTPGKSEGAETSAATETNETSEAEASESTGDDEEAAE